MKQEGETQMPKIESFKDANYHMADTCSSCKHVKRSGMIFYECTILEDIRNDISRTVSPNGKCDLHEKREDQAK